MKARTVKAAVLMVVLALLMAGCSFSRRSNALRKPGRVTAGITELDALKNENANLREQQKRNEVKIAQLEKGLATTQKEQQRFQRTMRSNFDMMEQSVTLTLSKLATGTVDANPLRIEKAKPAAKPSRASGPVRHQPEQKISKTAPMVKTVARAAPPASKKAGPPLRRSVGKTSVMKPSGEKRNKPPVLAGNKPAAPTRAARMAIKAPKNQAPPEARPSMAMDADLTSPTVPRKLSSHRPAKRLYEKGFALFAQKDFPQSILVFRNFLQRFPDDYYSDNAQFWIGESHRYLNQPRKAEAAYRQVLRNFEHRSTLEGYKTPDAMYRLGQNFKGRGSHEKARQFFQTLAQRFPDTSAGRRARTELSMLQMKTAANR